MSDSGLQGWCSLRTKIIVKEMNPLLPYPAMSRGIGRLDFLAFVDNQSRKRTTLVQSQEYSQSDRLVPLIQIGQVRDYSLLLVPCNPVPPVTCCLEK